MRGGHKNAVWGRVQRERALMEQDGVCPYCKMRLSRDDATREHVKPRSKGGTDEDSNIIAVHEFCNKAKGSMSRPRFKKLINGDGFTGFFNIDTIRILRRLDRLTVRSVRNLEGIA